MAQPNFFGVDLYDWAGHIPPKLQLLRPGVVLLAHGIWEHAVSIYNACGTKPWLILRWMDLDVTQHTPEKAADFICAKAKALMALGIKCIAHGLNEQYTNRERARWWELKFIERCHWHGVQTVCSNYSYANFDDWEAKDFKDVWAESDFNGPHLYDLKLENGFAPRSETSLRYRKWQGYPIEKHLCTEFGIEDGGWQILDGLTAGLVQERLLENVRLWKADGMLAATYFCMAHINELKWGPYYGLDSMYKFWGGNSPSFEPVEEQGMAEFKLGFKDVAAKLGAAVVGVPEMDEAAIPVGSNNGVANRVLTLQKTSKGLMLYTDNGTPLFLPSK